jgi:hypothetical protein
MIKRWRFLLILLFPVASYADGISVDTTTLQTSQFAFLVKLIAIDSARQLAKVKILKKFATADNVKIGQTDIQPAKVFDLKENIQYESVEWAELEKQPEVVLRIRGRAEPRAGKWVIEQRYWDATRAAQVGVIYFALNTFGAYEWVEYSKKREDKFALFYDEEKRNSEIKKLDVGSLVNWMVDQDFRQLAGAELVLRKELKLANLLKPNLREHLFEILFDVLGRQAAEFRKAFIREGVEHAIKELREAKVDPALVIQFTKLFGNYTQDRTDFTREAELMARLQVPPGDGELRREINRFHYEIKSRLDSKQPAELEKSLDQVLQIYELIGTDSTSSPQLSLSRFFESLKGPERSVMFQKIAKSLAKIGHNHQSSGELQSMLFELKKTPDVETAKILMKMDHTKAQTNIKVAVLEAVLLSYEQSSAWSNRNVQQSVLVFLDQYIDPKNPNFLSADVMEKYRKLKDQ